ncbi:integrase core domain-containing protein [Pseudarthrobacter sp. NPDC058196]|uniref:integrase core domain-containing protein n=1 Tax=Pseudarthrobacter sp. NPDC058196 TaxID=3346376 RepID=UPI0036DF30EA
MRFIRSCIRTRSPLDGAQQVERETAYWIRWFNEERLHSPIDYRPPVEYEQLYR